MLHKEKLIWMIVCLCIMGLCLTLHGWADGEEEVCLFWEKQGEQWILYGMNLPDEATRGMALLVELTCADGKVHSVESGDRNLIVTANPSAEGGMRILMDGVPNDPEEKTLCIFTIQGDERFIPVIESADLWVVCSDGQVEKYPLTIRQTSSETDADESNPASTETEKAKEEEQESKNENQTSSTSEGITEPGEVLPPNPSLRETEQTEETMPAQTHPTETDFKTETNDDTDIPDSAESETRQVDESNPSGGLYLGCRETHVQNEMFSVQFLFWVPSNCPVPALLCMQAPSAAGETITLSIDQLDGTQVITYTYQNLFAVGECRFLLYASDEAVEILYRNGQFQYQKAVTRSVSSDGFGCRKLFEPVIYP